MTSKHKTADQRPQEDCCRMLNCRINSVEGPLWGEVGIMKWILLGTIIAQADSGGDAIIESKEKIRTHFHMQSTPKHRWVHSPAGSHPRWGRCRCDPRASECRCSSQRSACRCAGHPRSLRRQGTASCGCPPLQTRAQQDPNLQQKGEPRWAVSGALRPSGQLSLQAQNEDVHTVGILHGVVAAV